MRFILAACFVSMVPATAYAAVLEVGAGQTYTTIQSAIDAAVPGDTVSIHAGEYVESLTLSQSGSADQRIAVQAAGDGTVTVRGAVEIEGDYWTLAELVIVVSGDVRGINVDGSFNHMTNLELSGGTRNGIDGSGQGNEVTGSYIHDFDGGDADAHCIVLNPGAEDWVIANNELIDCSGDSVQLYGPSGAVSRDILNTRIEGNIMRWTGGIGRMENAVDVKNADGLFVVNNEMSGFIENKTIVFQKGPINVVVRCNVMFGGFTGVEFRGEDGGTVENATFERNLMYDFTEYALKFDGVAGATVLHNTFVDAASDGLRIEGAGLNGGTIQNNLWLRTGSLDAGTFEADHNGYFETGSVGFASPTDVAADPLLTAEYELGDGSPMIDAGIDVGSPFEGAAPDIGAHEVGADICGAPPSEGGGGPGEGGGPSASGGSGPTGPGAGGGASEGGGSDSDASGTDDGGDGCDCAASSKGTPSSGAWLLAVLAVLLRRRRR